MKAHLKPAYLGLPHAVPILRNHVSRLAGYDFASILKSCIDRIFHLP